MARAFVEKWHFLADIVFLKHWEQYHIMKLARSFQLKQFQRGSIVFKENDPVEWVYFIFDGEFEIRKENVEEKRKTDRQEVEGIKQLRNLAKPENMLTKKTEMGPNRILKSSFCLPIS